MKKLLFLITSLAVSSCIFAQEILVSKKGTPILPEKGDWAVTINANPFLDYLGNFIGSNKSNNAPFLYLLNSTNSIVGKHFIDPSKAKRYGFYIYNVNKENTSKTISLSDLQKFGITPTKYRDDITKESIFNIALTTGTEHRRGNTRLQGYYGSEAGLLLSGGKKSYSYGYPLSETYLNSRPIEDKYGLTFGFGLRGFFGAEYFVFPKISIGGELGWAAILTIRGEGHRITESVNQGASPNNQPIGGSTNFTVGSDHAFPMFGPSGTLRLNFHF